MPGCCCRAEQGGEGCKRGRGGHTGMMSAAYTAKRDAWRKSFRKRTARTMAAVAVPASQNMISSKSSRMVISSSGCAARACPRSERPCHSPSGAKQWLESDR